MDWRWLLVALLQIMIFVWVLFITCALKFQCQVPCTLQSTNDNSRSFLFWTEMREIWGLKKKLEEKTWRLPEITLILKKPKDKKDSWLQEIFSTNTNSTRALLTHDCLKSGNVSHRIDYKLQKHHTKSFKIVVLNSLAQQEPFTKNDFNLGRCLHGFCLWHHSCLKNTLLVKENFLFRSLSAGHQFPPRVSPPGPPPAAVAQWALPTPFSSFTSPPVQCTGCLTQTLTWTTETLC